MQMVHKHLKRCSTSLNIRKMQIKTTIRYQLIPIRIASIKKNTNTNVGENVEKRNPCTLLMGM